MESGEIMQLFDSCWFEMEIFKKRSSPSASTSFEPNPDRQNNEDNASKPEFTRTPTLHTRSMSDQLNISTSFICSDSFSPDSVLHTPRLHKIISGKEITEEDLVETCSDVHQEAPRKTVRINTRKRRGLSKSLSDLEFEEVKGFMDLGFVFSEEDNKDSRLVEIIPGLQRLGKKEGEEEEKSKEADHHKAEISRPYLSEAWEVSERRRKENPLMNWRVPANLGNEIDMKDSLKWWAHTVASTVR